MIRLHRSLDIALALHETYAGDGRRAPRDLGDILATYSRVDLAAFR